MTMSKKHKAKRIIKSIFITFIILSVIAFFTLLYYGDYYMTKAQKRHYRSFQGTVSVMNASKDFSFIEDMRQAVHNWEEEARLIYICYKFKGVEQIESGIGTIETRWFYENKPKLPLLGFTTRKQEKMMELSLDMATGRLFNTHYYVGVSLMSPELNYPEYDFILSDYLMLIDNELNIKETFDDPEIYISIYKDIVKVVVWDGFEEVYEESFDPFNYFYK